MYKKILLILFLFLMTGCSINSTHNISLEENVEYAIKQNIKLYNVNSKGYRYYLPKGFKILEDKDYNQILLSNGIKFYLNVDIISYYNKNIIGYTDTTKAYKYVILKNDSKNGYLKIVKEEDYFFVEIVYNYGIIELEVEEHNLYQAVINATYILSSIKYNDIVIKNLIGENVLKSTESLYKIFSPIGEEDPRNFLDYVREFDNYESSVEDTDLIGD